MNKPRLIDANELIKGFYEHTNGGKQRYLIPEEIWEMVELAPTVYDIDKVVEQLSEKKALHEDLINYERQVGTFYERMQHEKAVEVLGDAIEIVRKSGVK